MMTKTDLAIVIPAYKAKYLEETLNSFAHQTDHRFHLYIGDDCSPEGIGDIVEKFEDKIEIDYKRFDTNLGGLNLVAHWTRCLHLICNAESYVCLFSDDDIVDSNFVEKFYSTVAEYKSSVYHYDLKIIDDKSEVISVPEEYPLFISGTDFFLQNNLKSDGITARMPEFIFELDSLLKAGGFIDFPLAMRSDNATVINMTRNSDIVTVKGSHVYWRKSQLNVSNQKNLMAKNNNFISSTILFYNWICFYFSDINAPSFYTCKKNLSVLRIIFGYSSNESFFTLWKIAIKSLDFLRIMPFSGFLFILFYIKNLLKSK